MKVSARFALAAIFVSALAAGCVDPLPLDGAPCPCGAGWHCCAVENQCFPDGSVCPLSGNCPLPPAASSLLVLGATDVQSSAPNFLPLPAGGRLALHHGPQGGYHLFIQVRLLGLDPAGLTLARALYDPADPSRAPGHALRAQSGSPPLVCEHDSAFILVDEQLTYVCPTQTGARMSERDLILRLDASDRDGRSLSGEWTIHPECPPGDPVCLDDAVVGCAGRD